MHFYDGNIEPTISKMVRAGDSNSEKLLLLTTFFVPPPQCCTKLKTSVCYVPILNRGNRGCDILQRGKPSFLNIQKMNSII